MAYILYIDTATDVCSAAIFERDTLVGMIEYHNAKQHAARIAPTVEHLLADLELSASRLSAVVVGKGPGSYTGLRVGVSMAKGLCMALEIPLFSVNSLQVLATQVQEYAEMTDAWICAMTDARRMEVYCAVWDKDLNTIQDTAAEIIGERPFGSLLSHKKILFVGDAVAKCHHALSYSPHALAFPNSLSGTATAGKLLWKTYQSNKMENLATFEPFYLKNFVATQAKKNIL